MQLPLGLKLPDDRIEEIIETYDQDNQVQSQFSPQINIAFPPRDNMTGNSLHANTANTQQETSNESLTEDSQRSNNNNQQ